MHALQTHSEYGNLLTHTPVTGTHAQVAGLPDPTFPCFPVTWIHDSTFNVPTNLHRCQM